MKDGQKFQSKEGDSVDLFHSPGSELLVRAFLALKTEEECRAFLEDLMTGKEIQDCGQRLFVAKLLGQQMGYSRIAQSTGASSATISRVNRCYTYGTGGYHIVLERLAEKTEKGESSHAT